MQKRSMLDSSWFVLNENVSILDLTPPKLLCQLKISDRLHTSYKPQLYFTLQVFLGVSKLGHPQKNYLDPGYLVKFTIAFFSCRPARPRPRPRRPGHGHGRLATATATRPRPRPPGHTQPATATASQPRPARPRPATCHGHRPRPPDQDSATQPLATRQSCCFAGYKGGCCDLCRLV